MNSTTRSPRVIAWLLLAAFFLFAYPTPSLTEQPESPYSRMTQGEGAVSMAAMPKAKLLPGKQQLFYGKTLPALLLVAAAWLVHPLVSTILRFGRRTASEGSRLRALLLPLQVSSRYI